MRNKTFLFLGAFFCASAAQSEIIAVSTFTRHGFDAAVMAMSHKVTEPKADPASKELWLYFYFPKKEIYPDPAPVVLIFPMLGGRNLWVEEQLAASFAKRGMASVITALPGQFERRTILDLPSGRLFLGHTVNTIASNFAQAQEDLAFVLKWLKNFKPYAERLDTTRVGIAGLSLGGLLSSIAMSRLPEIQTGAFMLAGADPAGIIAHGALTRPIVVSLGIKEEDIRGQLDRFDLSRNPGAYKNRPVLIVEAYWDRIIPSENRKKLRQSIPHAKTISLPAGHITAGLHLFWVKERIARFLEENLKSAPGER